MLDPCLRGASQSSDRRRGGAWPLVDGAGAGGSTAVLRRRLLEVGAGGRWRSGLGRPSGSSSAGCSSRGSEVAETRPGVLADVACSQSTMSPALNQLSHIDIIVHCFGLLQ